MKKTVSIVVVGALLVLIAWRLYDAFAGGQGGESQFGNRAMAVPVEISAITRATLRDIGEFSGSLMANSLFDVAPKVTGRLEKLSVNIGDVVRNGDLIAVLDNDEYEQQVIQAKAEIEVSNANLADARSAMDIAQREYERAQELQKQKIASATELDSALARANAARAKYQVAEAELKQRDASLKTAELRLSYTRIRATWQDDRGPRRVAQRYVDEGALLRVNDPIVSIVDLRTVKAIINVVEQDFPEIRIGQTATITTDAYGDRVFTGTIVRRAPVLQEESRQSRVEIEIANPDGVLAPGMFVRVLIQFAERADVVVVPITALVRRDGGQGVFIADLTEKVARYVKVQTGIIDRNLVEIVSPALEGQVVTLGQHLLSDGTPINLSDGSDRGGEGRPQTPAPQNDNAQGNRR